MPSPSGDPGSPGQRGSARTGCLFGILLLTLGVYAAIQILASEMDFRSLQRAVEQQARYAETRTDQEIRQDLVTRVRELGLPRSAENVVVRRMLGDGVLITVGYPDTVSFFGRWHWVRQRQISIR